MQRELALLHAEPQDVLVAHNTLVANKTHLVVGYGGAPYPPLNCTIGNNLIKGDTGTLVTVVGGTGTVWQNNILDGTAATGGIPASGYTRVNPLLTKGADGLYRPDAGSPLFGAAATGARRPDAVVAGRS